MIGWKRSGKYGGGTGNQEVFERSRVVGGVSVKVSGATGKCELFYAAVAGGRSAGVWWAVLVVVSGDMGLVNAGRKRWGPRRKAEGFGERGKGVERDCLGCGRQM